MTLTLVLGNKNYSSWSFRPWIAMVEAGIPFDEIVVPLPDKFGRGGKDPNILSHSPSGKVPALKDGDLVVWESLAIIEYVADKFPDAGIWPKDLPEKALARAVSHEMHGGFQALRGTCHMNMRREPSPLAVSDEVQSNVRRVEEIWKMCLERSKGPFLFGKRFTAADAMFAPVVNRFQVYMLSNDKTALDYMNTIMALPSWQSWESAAKAEKWTLQTEEI